jgi:predicted  nucleic acid-binding Zn-ribbon protein
MSSQVDQVSLQRLLDLQAEDTSIRRLTDQRGSLPEATKLAELTETLSELTSDVAIARKNAEEITRDHARIEGEIGLAAQKIEREEKRLFSGAVSNPKELGSLQAEVAMLKRKTSEMEDALLEVMVQKDDATSTLTSLEAEQATISAETETLRAKLEVITADIDNKLTQHQASRAAIAAELPEELLATYDKVREAKSGVGAAALVDGTCQGCHTKLPGKELTRLKAEGGLQRCDNCRRILVVA